MGIVPLSLSLSLSLSLPWDQLLLLPLDCLTAAADPSLFIRDCNFFSLWIGNERQQGTEKVSGKFREGISHTPALCHLCEVWFVAPAEWGLIYPLRICSAVYWRFCPNGREKRTSSYVEYNSRSRALHVNIFKFKLQIRLTL